MKRAKRKALTKLEYLEELIEDTVSAATDYGAEPTEAKEKELAFLSEMLYNAVRNSVVI